MQCQGERSVKMRFSCALPWHLPAAHPYMHKKQCQGKRSVEMRRFSCALPWHLPGTHTCAQNKQSQGKEASKRKFASIRGDAPRFKHIVSHLVATGTPGAPLVAMGQREKFWGPPLVALLLLLNLKKVMKEQRSKEKGQVPNQRLLTWTKVSSSSSSCTTTTATSNGTGTRVTVDSGPAAASMQAPFAPASTAEEGNDR
eukprot:332316-Pelagomonas_calceolata.AAC.3